MLCKLLDNAQLSVVVNTLLDPVMLETMLRSLGDQVRTTIRRECGDTARHRFDTSDVVQESLIQIWLNLGEDEIKRLINCKSWLRKIALGHRSKLKRKHLAKKRSVYMERLIDSDVHLEDRNKSTNQLQVREHIELVMVEIELLNSIDRRIVTQYIFENESFIAIAVDLKKDSQFVRRRYKRAIKTMAGNLQNKGLTFDE